MRRGHVYRRRTKAGGWSRWHAVIDLEPEQDGRRRIVLTAPDVADETVSGAFDTGNVDGFVSAVSRLHGLRTENDDKEIRLLSETS